jgi:hypothetical protein
VDDLMMIDSPAVAAAPSATLLQAGAAAVDRVAAPVAAANSGVARPKDGAADVKDGGSAGTVAKVAANIADAKSTDSATANAAQNKAPAAAKVCCSCQLLAIECGC